MREAAKLALAIALACTFAADFGERAASHFGREQPDKVIHLARLSPEQEACHKSDATAEGRPGSAPIAAQVKEPGPDTTDIWVILQGLSAPLLVALTLALTIVGWRQADVAKKQVEIARQQHIATHRPKVIVRSAELRFSDNIIDSTTGDPLVKIRVTNIGESRATILTSGFVAKEWNKRLGPLSIEGHLQVSKSKRILEAGESIEADIATNMTQARFRMIADGLQAEQRKVAGPEKTLVLFGSILYVDDKRIIRRTSVWRLLDISTLNMIAVDNPAYEYTD